MIKFKEVMHFDVFVLIVLLLDCLYSVHCISVIDNGHSLKRLYFLIQNTFLIKHRIESITN